MRDPAVTGRALRLAVWLLAALAVLATVQRLLPSTDGLQAAEMPLAWGPATYDEALAQLDRDVARERARVAAGNGAWMPLESLAMALHARGQLTGSHQDMAEALALADASRAAAPDGSGPVLARAITALSMHRNAVAAQEVGRMDKFAVPPDPADKAEGLAILGDVALYSGDYSRAADLYRQADSLAPGAGTQFRQAEWLRHRGEFIPARRLLEGALAQPARTRPWSRASMLLQLGAIELQAGHWQAAERRFAQADATFPGWWLAQAHMAQMAAVRGDYVEAQRLYRRAMVGTARPAVMDALAGVLEVQGDAHQAQALRLQARAIWNSRFATHPQAYADHAFDAALKAGDLPAAHRFAAYNAGARPYGDAQTGLARAEIALGNHARGKAMLETLERTGWKSTEQYVALADACEHLGDRRCWMRARRAAERLNPHAFDPRAALLSFGNH